MLSDIILTSSIPASKVPGLTSSVDQVGCAASAAPTILNTVTLPAEAFGTDGDYMEFAYYGQFNGAADSEITLGFGGGAYLFFDSGLIDPATNAHWSITGRIIRTGPLAQKGYATFVSTGLSQTQFTTGAADFSAPIAVECVGLGASANDVLLEGSFRQFYFQNR